MKTTQSPSVILPPAYPLRLRGGLAAGAIAVAMAAALAGVALCWPVLTAQPDSLQAGGDELWELVRRSVARWTD